MDGLAALVSPSHPVNLHPIAHELASWHHELRPTGLHRGITRGGIVVVSGIVSGGIASVAIASGDIASGDIASGVF